MRAKILKIISFLMVCSLSHGAVDLIPNVAFVGVASIAEGESFTVSCRVSNRGVSTSGSSYLGYYLSTDKTLDFNDQLIGTDYVQSLPANYYSSENAVLTIPASTEGGTYYILFVADYLRRVIEVNEVNNVIYKTISITKKGADLVPEFLTISNDSVVIGESISGSCYVKNIGGFSSSSSSLGYYLSKDSIWSSEDIHLATDYVSSLSVNSGEYESVSLLMPLTISEGSYYVLFVADYLENVTENNEVNNVGFVQLEVIASVIDLELEGLNILDDDVVVGGEFRLSYKVKNKGTKALGSSIVGYYLSEDTILDVNTDIYLSNYAISSLSKGGYTSVSRQVSLNSTIKEGTYTLFAIADYNNVFSEVDEQNNILKKQLEISPVKKDLLVLNPFLSSVDAVQGGTVVLRADVHNGGNVTSSSSYLGYYLSKDSVLDVSDTYLSRRFISAISAGSFKQGEISAVIPSETPAGDYYILFVADYQLGITEFDETNNMKSVPVTVLKSNIDLAVINLSVDGNVSAGKSLNISYESLNIGTTNSQGVSIAYYLSSDDTFEPSKDIYLSYVGEGSLFGGERRANDVDVTISSSIANGDYTLFVKIDYQNKISETDETNNVTSVPLKVLTIYGLDLVPTRVIIDKEITAAGKNVVVSSYVKNRGTVSSSSSNLGYYLSKDDKLDFDDVFLTSSFIASMYADRSVYKGETLTIPPSTVEGNYHILFRADYDNSLFEFDEKNNVVAVPITIEADKVDYEMVSLSSGTKNLIIGGSITVSAQIENHSTVSSENVYVAYYLSRDDVFSPSTDAYLGSAGALVAPGNTSDLLKEITPYSGGQTGAYYLFAKVDYLNQIAEDNEVNNVKMLKVNLVPKPVGKDLVVENVIREKRTSAGSYLSLSLQVRNTGVSATPTSYLGYYWSKDTVLDEGDNLLGTDVVYALSSGGASSESFSYYVPTTTPHGIYYVLQVADHLGKIVESNEINNTTALKVVVEENKPDLTFVKVKLGGSTDLKIGDIVTYESTVKNLGFVTSTENTFSIYISQDTILDSEDKLVGKRNFPVIYGLNKRELTGGFTVPELANGPYYVLFVLDEQNRMSELDETNNMFAIRTWVSVNSVFKESLRSDIQLTMFPLPCSEQLTIESNDKLINRIEVYDLNASLITVDAVNDYSTVLNASELTEGMYILNVYDEDGKFRSDKILIMK